MISIFWIFDPERFFDAIQESHVILTTEATYCGNDLCEDSSAFVPLTAEDIMRAKQRANVPGQKRKRPSSKLTLVVGFGDGRATWMTQFRWPDLYSLTDHGQLTLHIFIEKFEF